MKKSDIRLLMISIFIVVVVSIAYTVYSKLVTSTISDTLTTHIRPIAPTFNTTVIESIAKRKKVVPIFQVPGTTPAITAASKSASITPIETAPAATSAGSVN